MGFGAGSMLSAVAYELIPESSLSHGLGIGIGFLVGAFVDFVADRVIDQRGGSERRAIDPVSTASSETTMFLGALLDGIPEAFVLGISLATGGSVSVAFVTAVFVSNIPQGIAGTTSLEDAGYAHREITWMWTALTITCAVVAALGYQLGHAEHVPGVYSEAFAAGVVLTMLANSMMPGPFQHGGSWVGLYTVLGYLVAAALTVAG